MIIRFSGAEERSQNICKSAHVKMWKRVHCVRNFNDVIRKVVIFYYYSIILSKVRQRQCKYNDHPIRFICLQDHTDQFNHHQQFSVAIGFKWVNIWSAMVKIKLKLKLLNYLFTIILHLFSHTDRLYSDLKDILNWTIKK